MTEPCWPAEYAWPDGHKSGRDDAEITKHALAWTYGKPHLPKWLRALKALVTYPPVTPYDVAVLRNIKPLVFAMSPAQLDETIATGKLPPTSGKR